MPEDRGIAGIVLTGGKSSRMGQDKALLPYRGQTLVRHMTGILHELGLQDVFISGNLEGYPCIEDTHPAKGPVGGITSVLQQKPGYSGYLFIPVDMPLLNAPALRLLMAHKEGAYFIGWPLPAYITPPFFPGGEKHSVHGFLQAQGIYPIALPQHLEDIMKNANTPQQWEDIKNTP
jgi:molybdopterin-guanine dinucleotide biosynthesis protein A